MNLYPFQEHGSKWLATRPRSGVLADDMGLGKTVQTLRALELVGARHTLIVTRAACTYIWAQELDKWYPDLDYDMIDAKSMNAELREIIVSDKATEIVIVGYEMMRKLAPQLSRRKWDVVVFDEAHALSNRRSQTHKISRTLTRASCARRVWFLTGTPVQNHVQEYWPLLRVADTQFGSYWKFVHKYCNVEPVIHPRYRAAYEQGLYVPPRAILGQQVVNVMDQRDPRIGHLLDALAPYVLRRTKQDVYPELPAKTYTRIPIALDAAHRKMYSAMNTHMRCQLPNGDDCEVDTVLAQQTRLLQLCIDWRLLSDASLYSAALEGPKAIALMAHIEALDGRPFVVFSQWTGVLDLVSTMLADRGIASAEFTGKNLVTREDQLGLWNNSHVQALLVTIAAGGVGRDFTHADTAFFLDRSFNPKANLQAEDRLWRHGQTKPVNVYDIYARNTIEEHVHNVDDNKTHVANITVEALAE